MSDDDLLFHKTSNGLRAHPETLAVRVSREHYLWLADRIDLLSSEVRAIHAAVIQTVGGVVDGHPTQSINYLQRLRQLVDRERCAGISKDCISLGESCSEPFNWDDGVPYCDFCGMFRSDAARQARKTRSTNTA